MTEPAKKDKILLVLYEIYLKLLHPFSKLNKNVVIPLGMNADIHDSLVKSDVWIHVENKEDAYSIKNIIDQINPSEKITITLSANNLDILYVLSKESEKLILLHKIDEIHIIFFGTDQPTKVGKIVNVIQPKIMVIVGFKLYFALFYYLRQFESKIFLINVSLNYQQTRNLHLFSFFFQRAYPDKIFALDDKSCAFFSKFFNMHVDKIMDINLKFNNLFSASNKKNKEDADLIAKDFFSQYPIVMFFMIDQKEEDEIVEILKKIIDKNPKVINIVVPYNLKRINNWIYKFQNAKIPWIIKSFVTKKILPPKVIICDAISESIRLFDIADSAFVGSGLLPVTKNNLFYPVNAGLVPICKEYWNKFAWVEDKKELLDNNIVRRSQDIDIIAQMILDDIDTKVSKEKNIENAVKFFNLKEEGSKIIADYINKYI